MRWSLLRDTRGNDTWNYLQWFPRFFILIVIVIFVYYMFASYWNVDYDTKTIRAYGLHTNIIYGEAFKPTDPDYAIFSSPNTIFLEHYNASNLESSLYYARDEDLKILRVAPAAARLTLTYDAPDTTCPIDDPCIIYYQQETWTFYESERAFDRRRISMSNHHIRVIPAPAETTDEPSEEPFSYDPAIGMLTIEVIL